MDTAIVLPEQNYQILKEKYNRLVDLYSSLNKENENKDLNVSSGLVGLWETNKRIPSLEYFILLIDYFSVSADLLLEKDRKLTPNQYLNNTTALSSGAKKVLDTFNLLNEDNQDILVGEAKKMLRAQYLEEKSQAIPKAK